LDQLVNVNNYTVLATGIEVESLVVKTADVGTSMASPNDAPYDQSAYQSPVQSPTNKLRLIYANSSAGVSFKPILCIWDCLKTWPLVNTSQAKLH
jgi:hypothetical protein